MTHDPEEFSALAEGFLASAPERNVLATVLVSARAGDLASSTPSFVSGADDHGVTVAVAMRTPPWPILADGFETDEDAVDLVTFWRRHEPKVTGVGGQPQTARRIAKAWAASTGRPADLQFSEAMHSLTEVTDPPRPAAGVLRCPGQHDRQTLIAWERGFADDTGMIPGVAPGKRVDQRLAAGRQLIWDAGGPVCTVSFSPMIAGVSRIGPVYTPPEHRSRGYASAAVAATSRMLLAQGAERCMLLTDLANPTSNRIYAAVGYVRFAAWEQYRFSLKPDLPAS